MNEEKPAGGNRLTNFSIDFLSFLWPGRLRAEAPHYLHFEEPCLFVIPRDRLDFF